MKGEEIFEWTPRGERLWREAQQRNRPVSLGAGLVIGIGFGLVIVAIHALIGGLT